MPQPKQAIAQMTPYSPPEEGRMGYLRLDFNENTEGASPKVLEALRKITREECGCYPEYGDFVATLARFLHVEKTQVLPTNGCDEAIRALFDTYVDKGEEVILLTPSYSLYQLFAEVAGAKIVWISYREDFSFPLDEVLQAITPKTRLIALANPHNPTGTLLCREEVEKIVLANAQMVVLLDEAYAQFSGRSDKELIDRYSNVFVAQTFSKTYGLAGLRIGYLLSSKENIEMISRVLAASYSVDRISMAMALEAIEDQAYVDKYVKGVTQAREQFVKEIEALGFASVPSVANFVLVNFKDKATAVKNFLAQNGVLVREKVGREYLRITIGTQVQMERVTHLLRAFVRKEALIFDMDGVLIDESSSYRQCILKTVEHFAGKEIERLAIEEFKRKGGYNNDYDCTEGILRELGFEVNRQALIEKFDAYYERYKTGERWLLEEKILYQLKEKYRLGIFTGRPRKDAIDALQRFQKQAFFEVVITDDEVQKRKPDPEGLLLALERLGAKNARYVGDSIDDRETAKRASIPFIDVEQMQEVLWPEEE